MRLMILIVLLAFAPVGADESVYKILTLGEWEGCQGKDRLPLGKDDKNFIHLAEAHQVEPIARKFFPHDQRLVIVELDPAQLPVRLVHESNPGGTALFYHLYQGYLPFSAVRSHRTLDNSSSRLSPSWGPEARL